MQIKVYAVMDYHDQPIQFINRNYFQLKKENDDHYYIVVGMIHWMLILPIPLLLAVNLLLCNFEKLKILNLLLKLLTVNNEGTIYKRSNLIALFFTSTNVSIVLLAFHIISIKKTVNYGSTVFHHHDVDSLKSCAIWTSFIYFTILLVSMIGHFIYTWTDSHEMCVIKVIKMAFVIATVSIKINVIYISSYFMPYMLLAFVYNPLQTSITYFMITVLVVGVYLMWWGLTNTGSKLQCCSNKCRHPEQRTSYTDYTPIEGGNVDDVTCCSIKNGVLCAVCCSLRFIKCTGHICSYLIFSCAIIFSFIYIFSVIAYICELGSFNDFQAAHNLVVLALIGLVGIFVGKPVYAHFRQKFHLKFDERDKTNGAVTADLEAFHLTSLEMKQYN